MIQNLLGLMLNILTQDSLGLLSDFLLVIFTAVLAYFTYYLYQETRKSREYQIYLNQPELSVIFEPSEKCINWINIKITNIGRAPLYDLELENVENDLVCFNGKKISEQKYLQKINYLRPGQEINQFFVSFTKSSYSFENFQFSLIFRYRNNKGKIFRKKFDYDFMQFYDMSQVGEEPLNKLANELEKIQKSIRHLATGFKKLRVITQTKKEKQDEDKAFIKRTQKRTKKK